MHPSPSTSAPTRRRIGWMVAATAALLAATVGTGAGAGAAPGSGSLVAQAGDLGWEGPSFQGSSGSPSGSKPESKVWFHDGRWWAIMFDSAEDAFFIHYLDLPAQRWVRTATEIDDRTNSRADALWNGSQLFVASHRFANTSNSSGNPAELSRYSYSSPCGTYTLDPGFPVAINDVRSETLVIDEDSTGRLWATWRQSDHIYISHSTPGGASWSTPAPLPVSGADVSSDDISSVVAFGGDKIGVMWSNQDDETMYFAQRLDSDPPTTWSAPEVAYSGSDSTDDHINLKNVQHQDGRIVAAVKTEDSGSAVLVHLLDRDPGSGTWSSHPYGIGSEHHTRPIVVVDSTHDNAHLFATADESGGSIYEKVAPLDDISFASGLGTPVLTDADSDDINNPTSTKQSVTSSTGLVVLATNDTTREYWTHYDDLGGPGATPPPGRGPTDEDGDGIADPCDPTGGPVVLTPANIGVVEADVTVQLPIHLDKPSLDPVTVDYTTLDPAPTPGLSTAGSDYTATSGTLTIEPGETSGFVEIELHDDLEAEPNMLWGEWLVVTFSNPSPNAVLGGAFFHSGIVVTIDDD